jgi:hypothetical protein
MSDMKKPYKSYFLVREIRVCDCSVTATSFIVVGEITKYDNFGESVDG